MCSCLYCIRLTLPDIARNASLLQATVIYISFICYSFDSSAASPDDHPGAPGWAADPERSEPAVPAGPQRSSRRAPDCRADRGELPAAARRAWAAGQGTVPPEEDSGGDGAAHRHSETDALRSRRIHQEAPGDVAEQRAVCQGQRGGPRADTEAGWCWDAYPSPGKPFGAEREGNGLDERGESASEPQ